LSVFTNWHDHGSRTCFSAASAIRNQWCQAGTRTACAAAAVTCSNKSKVTIYNCRIREVADDNLNVLTALLALKQGGHLG
jgi:hypothetical protein